MTAYNTRLAKRNGGTMGRVLITGDVHGMFGHLNSLINKKRNDLEAVVCLGDFGYWPRAGVFTPDSVKPGGVPLYWLDGNHEDFDALRAFRAEHGDEVSPGVRYVPRGTVLELGGFRCLFIGGAESIDRASRTLGWSWFPDESISQADLGRALDAVRDSGGVDAVFSHTCPREFGVLGERYDKAGDPSRAALSELLAVARPKLWYFGHWHVRRGGQYGATQWTALHFAPESGWWTYLGERVGV